ncbi:hypothetical protein CTEN210_02918 [Chaetoceros tenuissimus]|uniref:Uncharacterized protein n=1 Tax=Chaetoceros tenuissimus TaxID=426638 RepID=A0AAD3H1I4_9STRA|nr:hypothetical protein CTEN210_02918 [Chaetoceros tenuissimus]
MGIYYCHYCGKVMCGEWFCCKACKFGEGGGDILCQDCATGGFCNQCDDTGLCCVYCVKKSKDMFPCCGMALCGAGTNEGSKDSSTCVSKHIMKTLPCGHKTCNFPLDEFEYEYEDEEDSVEDVEGESGKDVEEDSSKEVEEDSGKDVEGDSGKIVTGEKEKDKEIQICYKCLRAKAEEEVRKEDVAVIESIMVKMKSSKIKSMLQDIVDDPEGKKRDHDNERFAELEFELSKARNAYVACRCDARLLYY